MWECVCLCVCVGILFYGFHSCVKETLEEPASGTCVKTQTSRKTPCKQRGMGGGSVSKASWWMLISVSVASAADRWARSIMPDASPPTRIHTTNRKCARGHNLIATGFHLVFFCFVFFTPHGLTIFADGWQPPLPQHTHTLTHTRVMK